MRAAVTIITLERHPLLAATLEALQKVDLAAVESILIIDQSETPFDPAPHRSRISVPIRVVHSPPKGLAHARNLALQQLDSDIVLFMDDDVVPEPDLVQAHLASYVRHPEVLGVAGYERIARGAGPGRLHRMARRILTELLRPVLAVHPRYRPYLDEDGYPVGIVTRSGLFLCDFSRPKPCAVMTPRGCNMSFRRAPLVKIGGFDERFTGPHRDETDLALRLLAAFPAGQLVFNPRARLIHLMAPSGGCRSGNPETRAFQALRSEVRFGRRHLGRIGYRVFALRLTLAFAPELLRRPRLLGMIWQSRASEQH